MWLWACERICMKIELKSSLDFIRLKLYAMDDLLICAHGDDGILCSLHFPYVIFHWSPLLLSITEESKHLREYSSGGDFWNEFDDRAELLLQLIKMYKFSEKYFMESGQQNWCRVTTLFPIIKYQTGKNNKMIELCREIIITFCSSEYLSVSINI